MPLVWVTGISGAGKSTVCHRLVERGYDAHDVDEDGFREWRDRATNLAVPDPADWHDPEVTGALAYRVRRDRVEQLRGSAQHHHVFLFGTVDNELEVWELFDLVVCLVIDDDTLRHRLETRADNRFGKAPHELELILGWNRSTKDDYRRFGAVIIDATRPIDDVANAVLDAAHAPH